MYELLIVDDEPLIREYMKQNIPFFHKDWVVSGEAMDGLEALELMKKQHFDLVITDIRMPEMDGLEFVGRVKQLYDRQMIAILSGYDDFSYAKEAMSCGVREYLLKPLVKSELCALLEKVSLLIEEEKRKRAAYRTLLDLSDESMKQAAKNFLKAALVDSNLEPGASSEQDNNCLNRNEIVEKAREYIYTHYPEPISLALVAEKIGVSHCYLSDIFRKSTGESYIKFLTRIRMEQAAMLLKALPPQKIQDISEQVGYINVRHFSSIFKQYYNMTPGEYQNKPVRPV